MVESFIDTLTNELEANQDAENAIAQKAYMRDQFEYYGLTTTTRRNVQKPFFVKEFLPSKAEMKEIVQILWLKPQREYQYIAQELAFKYVKNLEEDDIELFEFMIINHSWWDTVDHIANKLMGAYFKKYPEFRQEYVTKWLESNNIWLQRSALLFQLKYKNELDVVLLETTIVFLLGSSEFFINKAIGWVLREYSRVNPLWVSTFVERTPNLNKLSKKEALRLIKK